MSEKSIVTFATIVAPGVILFASAVVAVLLFGS